MSPPFFFAATALVFWGPVFYLGWRFVRANERRSANRDELEELRSRVGRLEEELATATTELDRLSAGHQFTTQLLAGRVSAAPASHPAIAEADKAPVR